jgi:integrase
MAVLNKLSAKAVEVLHRQGKVGKHTDGGGLYLHITDAGGCYWRYKYRVAGKEKLASFGTFPEVSLAQAREKHLAARGHVDEGNSPVEVKRKAKAAKVVEDATNRPFRDVAQEWMTEMVEPHKGERTVTRAKANMATLVAAFGTTRIGDVRLPHLAEVLLRYQRAGKFETRRRIQQTAANIMGMAENRGYLGDRPNPFIGANNGAGYTSPDAVRRSRPAITDRIEFGKLLADIERASDIMTRALRLLALTLVRPGELAQAEWKNIDWKRAVMVVPAEVLKMRTERKGTSAAKRDLEVPLARQTIVELQALYALTGTGRYLFPARSDKNKLRHLRETTINTALNQLDYQGIHCAHGFRSSGSTMINEERRIIEGEETERWVNQRALVELQLDHNDASVQAIYDRGGRWKDRCAMMQVWADRIDEMRGQRAKLALVA